MIKETQIKDKQIKKNNNVPKLLIISHGRWGKDTLAEIFRDNFGLNFTSSSQAASDIFIFNELKDKYGYNTPEECFEDRVNHRAEWYDLMRGYNKEDNTRLARGILNLSDAYIGMRNRDEIDSCLKAGLFDLVIWVDSSARLPEESKDSFNIDESCADIIIENNGTLEQFKEKAIRLGNIIFNSHLDKPVTKPVNFINFFNNLAVFEDKWFLDIKSFFDRAFIRDWPEVVNEDKTYGKLGYENWEIISLDKTGMQINCGNDNQNGTTVIIKANERGAYVDSHIECHKWVKGLSVVDIRKILKRK